VAGLVVYQNLSNIQNFENQVKESILNFFTIKNTIIFFIAFVTCFYSVYRIVRNIKTKRYLKKRREEDISNIRWAIPDLMKKRHSFDLHPEDRMKLEEFIPDLNELIARASKFQELDKVKEELKQELRESDEELKENQENERLRKIRARELAEEKRLEEIELRKEQIAYHIEWNKKQALNKFIGDKRIFKKDCLTKKQCQALLEDGFKQVNEYCVLEKKRIPILARPFGNHTISHEFLVWSSKRLLKSTEGVKNIQEHLTRDADLTFEFNGKKFALEIEKGELLRKHQQLKEKIDYLNKNYPKRWMIVVSNRDFFTRYKKFGFTSTRMRLSENLSKLLKNAHTKIADVF
jgi:hypothetical protein